MEDNNLLSVTLPLPSNNIIIVLSSELEICQKKLKDVETRKKLLEEEHARTLLAIQTHINAENILREENEKFKEKINLLQKENDELKERVSRLEKKELNETNLLKISQCIFNYKEKVWTLIFKNEYKRQQRIFGKDNLRDILQGKYDDKLTKEQVFNKDKIVYQITKKYEIDYFFHSLNDINSSRNTMSHPKIESEYEYLQPMFLEYCNNLWESDKEENIIFTDFIFSLLKE